MKSSLRVEFHCHSRYSIDSLNKIPDLLKTAHKRGIDRLVITDHNTIRGVLEAQALDGELVIVGEEIKTTKGELLASFVTDEIPEGLEPLEAIHRLRKQGAFISVSHPFDLQRSGWQLTDLMFILPLVDAIEVFNFALHQSGLQRSGFSAGRGAEPGRHGRLGCACAGRTGTFHAAIALFRDRR